MQDFGLEDFKNANVRIDAQSRSSAVMPPSDCEKVVSEVMSMCQFNATNKAMAAISGVCQRGGTNRSASSVSAAFTIEGKQLTARQFSDACKKIGGTPRQFARAMGTIIYKYAKVLGEEGDLARQYSIENPNMT